MKRICAALLMLLIITWSFSCGFCEEELYIAYGIQFGASNNDILSSLSKYPGLMVEGGETSSGTIYVGKGESTELNALGRDIRKITFWYTEDGLYKTDIEFSDISSSAGVIGGNLEKGSWEKGYLNALDSWPEIVIELNRQFGTADSAAVFWGYPDVKIAKSITLSDVDTSEKIEDVMPLETCLKYDMCGFVFHFKNVMVELHLHEYMYKSEYFGKTYTVDDELTITYADSIYGDLVEILPTPAPTLTPGDGTNGSLNLFG